MEAHTCTLHERKEVIRIGQCNVPCSSWKLSLYATMFGWCSFESSEACVVQDKANFYLGGGRGGRKVELATPLVPLRSVP